MSDSTVAAPVVVVGGGITGLACWWRLHQLGVDAVVLEASARAGGAVRSESVGGLVVERGPNTVQGTPELLELIRAVGLDEERVEAPRRLARYVVRDGVLHALPDSLLGLAACGVVSAAAKARMTAEVAIPPRRDGAEETVEQFFARRFGGEVVDALVAPFVSGTFAGDPTRLSAEALFPSLVALERRHGSVIRGLLFGAGPRRGALRLTSLRGGLERLVHRVADRAGDRLSGGARVARVRHDPSTREFVLEGRDAGGPRRWTARAVVLAVAAWDAAPLLTEIAPAAAAALAAIEAPPLAVVSLAWPRSAVAHPLDGFGFLVARHEPLSILGCLWPGSIFPQRGDDGGRVCMTSFVGGARFPERAHLDDAALIATVAADLERVLGVRGAPEVLAIARYERAIPQYTIGHPARIERLRAEVGAVPGLFVTGNFLGGIALGECVRQGFETAAAVERARK